MLLLTVQQVVPRTLTEQMSKEYNTGRLQCRRATRGFQDQIVPLSLAREVQLDKIYDHAEAETPSRPTIAATLTTVAMSLARLLESTLR